MPEQMPEIEVTLRWPLAARAILALSWLWPYFGHDFARRLIQWAAGEALIRVGHDAEWELLFPEGVVL